MTLAPPHSFYSGETTTVDAIHLQPGPGGRHIMVAIDRSSSSWAGFDFCIKNIAKPEDVITLFLVLDPRDLLKADNDQENYRTSNMVEVYEQAKEMKLKASKEFHFRVHAVYHEDPRVALLQKINLDPKKYSLLIMGSRGVSSLAGVVLGSVSTYMLNQSPIPVVVTRDPIQ
jgi:nucleotide-binding universal stress UspA family protein